MGDINKKIIIDADASGVERAMDDVNDAANDAKQKLKEVSDTFEDYGSTTSALYERLKKEAEEYSDKIKEQEKYIRDMLDLENKRNEISHKQQATALEDEREKRLDNALTDAEKKKVNEQYDFFEKEYDSEYMARKREILEAEQQRVEESYKRKREDDEEEEDGEDGVQKKKKGRGMFYGSGRAVASGLGIGVGLGIAGILYETIKQADNYQKSLKELNGVMGGLGGTADRTGVSLGKSATEMNKFVEGVARATGGIGDVGQISSDLLKVAKAFSLDEGQVTGLGRYMKMGTKDVLDEFKDLVKDLDKSGAVSIKDNNFADLSSQIEYWSRLQEMQSSQVLKLTQGQSSDILSAFEKLDFRGTGAKDERIMNTIENVNQAITNPDNDFKRAFMYRWLSNNGQLDFYDTSKRMEQGVFGKDNFRDVLEGFLNDNKAMDFKNKILKFKEQFGFELLQDAEAFYKSIEDPNKREEFYGDLGEALNGSGDKKINFQKKWKGIDVGGRAAANTAFSEKVIANMNNIFAGAGIGILDGLNEVMPKGGFTPGDISGLISSGLQAIGFKDFGEMFQDAVNIFKVAVNGFKTVIGWLPGQEKTSDEFKRQEYEQAKNLRGDVDVAMQDPLIRKGDKDRIAKAQKKMQEYFSKNFKDWDMTEMQEVIGNLIVEILDANSHKKFDSIRRERIEKLKKDVKPEKTTEEEKGSVKTGMIISDDNARLLVQALNQFIDKSGSNTGALQDLTRSIDGKFNQRGPRGEMAYVG